MALGQSPAAAPSLAGAKRRISTLVMAASAVVIMCASTVLFGASTAFLASKKRA